MIITKKALPRRLFLRGLGTTLALPLLDAMIPSMTALASTPANPARLRRLGFVYIPMGCDVSRWTPPGAKRLDALSPSLSPLAAVRDPSDATVRRRIEFLFHHKEMVTDELVNLRRSVYSRPDFERAITNTLVLRVSLAGEPTFRGGAPP